MKIRNRGFTLIESLIVIALVGVMAVVLTEFFFGSNYIYRTQNAELDVNFTGRSALDDIDFNVRQATQVGTTYLAYNTGPTELILEVQSVDGANELVPGTFDRFVFYLNGTSLYREIFADPGSARESSSKLIGSNITSLEFTYDSADMASVSLVTTNLVITQSTGREVHDLTISSASRLRN